MQVHPPDAELHCTCMQVHSARVNHQHVQRRQAIPPKRRPRSAHRVDVLQPKGDRSGHRGLRGSALRAVCDGHAASVAHGVQRDVLVPQRHAAPAPSRLSRPVRCSVLARRFLPFRRMPCTTCRPQTALRLHKPPYTNCHMTALRKLRFSSQPQPYLV